MTVQIAYARRPLARRGSFAGLAPLGPDQFEGYASLFEVADGAGDIVAPGAFAASLRRRGADGVLLGSGLKAQVAALTQQLGARDLAEAKTQAASLAARQAQIDAGEKASRAHAVTQAATETQIQTVLREVPVYVTPKAAAACALPWGFVRLLDAAASGADPDDVRTRLAPGQPDDAASDVGLPEALALLAADLGAARQNAGQLAALEKAVAADTTDDMEN